MTGPQSRIERFFNSIPLLLSYGILSTTWFAFIFVISIHQTLFNRQEIIHAISQQIIGNTLFFLTFFSLIIASNRQPGSPKASLRPHNVHPPSPPSPKIEGPSRPQRFSQPDSPAMTRDEDDIPLRYLRNSNWVNSRIGKDRPSPLPLHQSMAAKQSASKVRASRHARGVEADNGNPTIPPLTLIPLSAKEAGEDLDERNEEKMEAREIEGRAGIEEADHEDNGDQERLLSRTDGNQGVKKSIMAKSDTGGPRWCKKCDEWKPDRSHHCRYCRQCNLKMDHHCVWLGNCVGFHNYKPFLLFISYSTVLSFYTMLEAGYETVRFLQEPDEFYHPPLDCTTQDCNQEYTEMDLAPVIFIAIAILGGIFLLAVGSLAGYHWWLALNNLTTLESLTHSYPSVILEDDIPSTAQSSSTPKSSSSTYANPTRVWKPDHLLTRNERNRLRREAREINVYDLGWKKNLQAIFGDRSVFLALWPKARAYHKADQEAGHFFDVDERKLDRLKTLTRELRLGREEVNNGHETESEDESEDERDYNDVDGTPFTAESGYASGSDEEDQKGEEEMRSARGDRGAAWFQA